jgi:thiamine-phosphate pyrophosphorylase
MLRYAITSRALYPGDDGRQQAALGKQASSWAANGIDFIQLREKDLPSADLVLLARNLLTEIHLAASPTKLLVNSRPDIAIAAGCHGVHLTSDPDPLKPNQLNAGQIRTLYASANLPPPIISCSCHNQTEIEHARSNRVDLILFAPVFEKPLPEKTFLPGQGLDRLREACAAAAPIPVLALGGITPKNSPACLHAGAAGVAGIRLFHLP